MQDAKPSRQVEGRRSPRLRTDELAKLRLLSPLSPDEAEARIVNVSEYGLCLQTTARIPQGAYVQVRLKGIVVFGTVCYCLHVPEGYRAGMKVETVVPKLSEAATLTRILAREAPDDPPRPVSFKA